MLEVWKDIIGYEGLYQVSSLGRIKSIGHTIVGSNRFGTKYNKTTVGRVLKTSKNRGGYKTIHLCKDSNKDIFTVHRIVASVFIGVRPEGMQINHKDGNKCNNSTQNLEYVTPKENSSHALANKLRPFQTYTKLSEFDVIEIIRLCRANNGKKQRDGEYIPKREIAKKFGVTGSLVGQISKNRAWKHLNPALAQEAEE